MDKEKIEQSKLTAFVSVMILVSFAAGVIATAFVMQPDEPKTDMNVRDHDRAIVEQLNQIALTLNEIRDRESEDYSVELAEMEYILYMILEDTSIIMNRTPHSDVPAYPEDEISIDFINNTTLRIEFYNNHLNQFDFSPPFTVENWTDIAIWGRAKDSDTFTKRQTDMIIFIMLNMAYYKETGTWLGE